MAGLEHPFHGRDRFVASDVREPGRPDDVAGGVEARDGRCVAVVAVIGFEIAAPGELETKAVGGRELWTPMTRIEKGRGGNLVREAKCLNFASSMAKLPAILRSAE